MVNPQPPAVPARSSDSLIALLLVVGALVYFFASVPLQNIGFGGWAVIALAAIVVWCVLTASKAWTERGEQQAAVTAISILAGRTRTRLIELYSVQLREQMQRYTWHRSGGNLEAADLLISKLRALGYSDYSVDLAAATAPFSLRRDLKTAMAGR
jgi:hypothetical protein